MKIKVDIRNAGAIQGAADLAEGKAHKRLYSFPILARKIADAEKFLSVDLRLPKALWRGVKFNISMGDGSTAHRWGRPSATFVTVERGSRGWYVVNVSRHDEYPEDGPPRLQNPEVVREHYTARMPVAPSRW